MTRRPDRWTLVPTALAAVLIGLSVWHWYTLRVTKANFESIRPGMKMDQVRALLGEPHSTARDLGFIRHDGRYAINGFLSEDRLRADGYRDYDRYLWSAANMWIVVIATPDGKVATVRSGTHPSSLRVQKLKRWFRRLF